ncbi:MAG: efflux RND transporter periplasmic adaptor subunit, partial [Parvularculaceae bacterium]|nr:efflux RND transporter periplasmic adaptor subunit [Parvularculaceae bacterium]
RAAHKNARFGGDCSVNVMGKIEAGAATKPPKSHYVLWLAIAGAAIIGVIGFKVLAPKPKPAAATAETGKMTAQLITAAPAELRSMSRRAPVSGDVRPVNDVRVFAPSTGVRVAQVLADIGDQVAAGAPLARLEAGVAEAQIRSAQAQLEAARVDQLRAVAEYKRAEAIAASGALSSEAIEARKAAADSATARYNAQRAALSEVNTRVGGGFVRAPVAGLVIERTARVGEFADRAELFRIVGDNRLEIAAQVSESDILALKVGQKAVFQASDGATVEATLRRPPVAISPETRTGEALFDLPPDTAIRSGMYLRGEVAIDKGEAIAVPQTAVSYATGEPSVFVVENGIAKRRAVTLGGRSGEYVAVLRGVAQGELVASSGGAFLQDGDAVRLPQPEAKPKAEAAAGKSG